MACLDDTTRCTRCLEEVQFIVEPRILPCTHVYCMICLEAVADRTETGVKIVCSRCSKEHCVASIEALPNVTDEKMEYSQAKDDADLYPAESESVDLESVTLHLHTDDQKQQRQHEQPPLHADQQPLLHANQEPEQQQQAEEREEATPYLRCAKCTEQATVYCVDCSDKYCTAHRELHDAWYEKKHQSIDIDTYLMRPNLYVKPTCSTHQSEMAMACQHCLKLSCAKCSALEETCSNGDGGTKHSFNSLRDVEGILKSEMDNLLSKCSDKLNEMGKVEKATWLRLDQIQENCDNMKQQVEAKVETRITQIRREGDEVLQQINSYQTESGQRVEEYLEGLRGRRESLEALIHTSRQFLREHHVTEIIKQKKEKCALLETAGEAPMDQCSLRGCTLRDEGIERSCLQMNFKSTYTKLEYISTHETGSTCYCITTTPEGHVIAGCGKGLILFDEDMDIVKHLPALTVTCVYFNPQDSRIYFIHLVQGKTRGIRSVAKNLRGPVTEIANYEDKQNVATYLSIIDDCVIVKMRYNSTLKVFDLIRKEFNDIQLPYPPRLCFNHPDGSLLVTGDDDVLYKYDFRRTNELDLIWSCPGLTDAYGMCVMDDGTILVNSSRNGQMFVISANGTLRERLEDENINPVSGGLAINGDIINLPCWQHHKLLRYRVSTGADN